MLRHTPPPGLAFDEPDDRLQRGIQYAAAFRFHRKRSGIPDHPLSRYREQSGYAAGTGSAVTDLIFSIAKRDVTFFSGTAPISFL